MFDNYLMWSILLLLGGILIVAIELFVPSGGVLGILSAGAIVGSIVFGFMHSIALGITMTCLTVVILPIVIVGAFKIWPHTPLGKLILIPLPKSQEEVLPPGPNLKQWIGRYGKAVTKMLPAGEIELNGETFEALSEGAAVDPGEVVKVVAVRTNRLIVRRTELPADANLEGGLAGRSDPSAPVTAADGSESPADRPAGWLGALEDLEVDSLDE